MLPGAAAAQPRIACIIKTKATRKQPVAAQMITSMFVAVCGRTSSALGWGTGTFPPPASLRRKPHPISQYDIVAVEGVRGHRNLLKW